MQVSQTLIDKASETCGGSRRALAKRIGETSSFLSKVETGKSPMPPGLAARLAQTGGEDAITATLNAVIEAEKDPDKKAAIAAALGMRWVAEAVRFELTVRLPLR